MDYKLCSFDHLDNEYFVVEENFLPYLFEKLKNIRLLEDKQEIKDVLIDNFTYYKLRNDKKLSPTNILKIIPKTNKVFRLLRWLDNQSKESKEQMDKENRKKAEKGSLFHKMLEEFYESDNDVRVLDYYSNMFPKETIDMVKNFQNRENYISIHQEVTIKDYDLYTGTIDSLGFYNNNLCIVDYKTYNKALSGKFHPFLVQKIEDYFKQLIMYHNLLINTKEEFEFKPKEIEKLYIFIFSFINHVYYVYEGDVSYLYKKFFNEIKIVIDWFYSNI